ncbi:S49 family peptidase [Bradyrhizobium sp. UNPA324]|uniref:S49 family peptidase n=1 Tax=Bradyrhizobium sp. UNPA324 TaxID=1141174 RepID=UPI0011546564|nr:S49 family peptidase [Bradyrhizobium sp. UNPA324]
MSSTGITFEHLKSQLFNRPLLVDADRIAVMIDVLADRTGIAFDPAEIERANVRIDRLPVGARAAMRGPARPRSPNSGDKLYPIEAGTAVIPVHGTLVNRGAWVGPYSGLTSYEGLRRQFREAAADEDVKSVILDVDSAGGQASGAFEIAAVVRELRASKPVVAVVNDMAASAAYALASAATKVIITPSGVAGSIGVVLAHFDHSARLDKAGVRPTLIHAGARKIDANPFQPLPEGVQKNLQAEVDKFYEMFVETVALNRPSLTPAAIRGTEAATFIGKAAIDAGLADQIGGMEEALAHVRAAAPKPAAEHGLHGVQPAAQKSAPPQLSPFEAALAAAHAAAAQKAVAEAAERARQKAISDSWASVVDDLARRTRGP